MSRFQPAAIEDIDLEIAQAPAIGGEHVVFVSDQPVYSIGDVRQPAEDSGILTLNAAYNLPAAGKDLQLIVDRAGARANEDGDVLSVTFGVTFADSTTGTATGTFSIPDRVPNQGRSVPRGMAVDVIGAGAGSTKKIKTVHNVQSVVGGAVNNRFELVALPEIATFIRVGCTTAAGLRLPVGSSLSIPCGLNASRFTKRGRGEPGTLNVTENYSDYLTGLTRANGLTVTAMVEVQKDERVVTDRFVLANWRPMASPEIGDGDDVVTASSGDGNFGSFAVFTAL